MSNNYKTALRHLMTTLEDGVKFTAYHQANNTTADAKSAMQSLIAKLKDMRTLGDSIIAEFESKKDSFDPATRTEWDDAQATKIIEVMQQIRPHLEKLADEEKRAPRSLGGEAKFGFGYGAGKITATSLLRHVDGCIKAEQNTIREKGSHHSHAPFQGIKFDHEPKPPRSPAFISL